MTRAPLAAVAASFAIGIGLTWWLAPSALQLWCTLGGVGLLFLWARDSPTAANSVLLLLFLLLGAFRAWTDLQIPAYSIVPSLTCLPQPIQCEGVLVSDIEWHRPTHGPARQRGWLEVTHIKQSTGWIPACGRVLVGLPTYGERVAYGDRVRISGAVRAPYPAKERFDETNWFWVRGACGRISISDPGSLVRLPFNLSPWVRYRRWVAVLRLTLQSSGRSLLGPAEAAYLEALLLGEGQGIAPELKEAFRKTGTIHVLVVSGLQVGLIGMICLVGLSIARVPRSFRYPILIGFLIFYCTLTGFSPPVLRSTLMGILLSLTWMKGGESSPMNGLGLAALVILAFSPRSLADSSFQLSFAAVGGLMTLGPWIARPLLKISQSVFWRPVVQGIAASCGAWLATVLLVGWHFHRVSLIALLANLIVVPWASLLTATGFLLYILSELHLWGATLVALTFTGLAHALSRAVVWMAGIPGASWSL